MWWLLLLLIIDCDGNDRSWWSWSLFHRQQPSKSTRHCFSWLASKSCIQWCCKRGQIPRPICYFSQNPGWIRRTDSKYKWKPKESEKVCSFIFDPPFISLSIQLFPSFLVINYFISVDKSLNTFLSGLESVFNGNKCCKRRKGREPFLVFSLPRQAKRMSSGEIKYEEGKSATFLVNLIKTYE